ncbi:MAG: PilZ domain-containing protein [Deltaproteobacteria bacterium]|nr:PilZ domain-containing protein [Deltaproteobacteria bacterium]
MGEEKRVHDRTGVVLPLRVQAGERALEGESVDISAGGVRVSLPEDLPFGAKVKVHVVLPTLGEETAIDAEVRWSRKDPSGWFLVGLQFQRVRARETWALNQLMRRA